MARLLKGQAVKYINGKAIYNVARDVEIENGNTPVRIVRNGSFYSANAQALLAIDPILGEVKITEKDPRQKHDVSQVIFNPPATIVYFADGSKEVVKVAKGEVFDYSTGVHLCVMKKLLGAQRYQESKKYLFEEMKKAKEIILAKNKKRNYFKRQRKSKPKPIKPIFKVGDILQCEKSRRETWEEKGEIRIVKELDVSYMGGLSYKMDNGAGINYTHQNHWKKIGEKLT